MKAVLIGMNNPQGNAPFAPVPISSSGWRLWKLLQTRIPGMSPEDYVLGYEFRNLCPGRNWDTWEARRNAQEMWPKLAGRRVVVFGDPVRLSFGLPGVPLGLPQLDNEVEWRHLPHPSGRSHWYNEHLNQEVASLILEELYERDNGPKGLDSRNVGQSTP